MISFFENSVTFPLNFHEKNDKSYFVGVNEKAVVCVYQKQAVFKMLSMLDF